MDAATRRELDELRRRAYGPRPDIADDPVALARLVALEDLARPAPPRPPLPAAPPSSPLSATPVGPLTPPPPRPSRPAPRSGDAATADPPVTDSPVRAPTGRRMSRRRLAVIVGASVAVVLVVVAAVQVGVQVSGRSAASAPTPIPSPVSARVANHFVSDPGSRILTRFAIGGFVPGEGQTDRSVEIGEAYGWRVDILNTSDGTSCIVLTRGTAHRNCVSDSVLATGGLMVALPYAAVPKADRPFGMRKNQSIGYWLLPDGRGMVILGPTSALAGD